MKSLRFAGSIIEKNFPWQMISNIVPHYDSSFMADSEDLIVGLVSNLVGHLHRNKVVLTGNKLSKRAGYME